eukprot:4912040-Pleurochrysis_carterae.AAC.10
MASPSSYAAFKTHLFIGELAGGGVPALGDCSVAFLGSNIISCSAHVRPLSRADTQPNLHKAPNRQICKLAGVLENDRGGHIRRRNPTGKTK